MSQDTIPVRPDEALDGERVAAYLRGKLPGTENELTVRQFGGGAANLTYLLDFQTHEYVLRRPPLGPVAPSAHDMHREYRVLSVLHRAFPLAPQAFLYCDDESVVGAPFVIMERRHGIVVRRKIPAAFALSADAPRAMSVALVDALADFHAVDYAVLGLEDLGRPEGFIRRQIAGWHRRWRAAQVEESPAMENVHTWLVQNEPPAPPPTLVHNDYKLDNVAFAEDDPGRIVAVYDWDMATLGDPYSDLGALLTYWTEPDDPPYLQAIAQTFMPVGDSRFLTRAQLVDRYAARSGRHPADVRFYHVLGMYRVAVIIAQIYIRYVRGQTQDERFAAFGPPVSQVAGAAERLIVARA